MPPLSSIFLLAVRPLASSLSLRGSNSASPPKNSVWRRLIGPNDDWPLAVCDYTSLDADKDIVIADRLNVNRIGENQLLHPNRRHRWYYIKGQQPENLLVFRNIDSTGQRASK